MSKVNKFFKNNIIPLLLGLLFFSLELYLFAILDSLVFVSIYRIVLHGVVVYILFKILDGRNIFLKILGSVVYILSCCVLLAIIIYYKYFYIIPNFNTLFLSGQTSEILEHIYSYINFYLLIYIGGFLLLPVLFCSRKSNPVKKKQSICLILSVVILYFLSGVNLCYTMYFDSYDHSLTDFHFKPLQGVQNFGLICYWTNNLNKSILSASYDSHLENPVKNRKNLPEKPNYTNFIVIQVESLDNTLIDLKYKGFEVIPTINRLKNQGIYFPNFYAQHSAGGSSDAEVSALTGILPLSEAPTMTLHQFSNLPSVVKTLAEFGYKSYAFHANSGHYWNRIQVYSQLGFNKFFDEEYYTGFAKGFASLDELFFQQTVPLIEKVAERPFFIYIITQSMHGPYTRMFNTLRNKTLSTGNNEVDSYFKAASYTDACLGIFLNELYKKGFLKNTNIIIYGDHTSGVKTETYSCNKGVSENIPLIIIPAANRVKGTVNIFGSHVNIPAIILDLAGIKQNKLFAGSSLLDTNVKHYFPVVRKAQDYVVTPKGTVPVYNMPKIYNDIVKYSKSFFYKID